MKKYVSFHDSMGKSVGCGNGSAYISRLKSKKGLLHEARNMKGCSNFQNNIVFAKVFNISNTQNEDQLLFTFTI